MGKKRIEFIRAVKFTLFSISAGIIQALSFALMDTVLKWNYTVAYMTALILSILWNFTLNRNITFKSANNIPIALLKVSIFYVIFLPLSTWGGTFLVDKCRWNEYLVLAISMLLNFVLEFLYDRFFVFRGSLDTRDK